MTRNLQNPEVLAPLAFAAERAIRHRGHPQPLHAAASADDLRQRFCVDLPDAPRNSVDVLNDLVAAAEPGLIGTTHGNFFAWVMGGSHPVGVAADWLTSAWGQNAAIYQTAPSAAIAEEAAAGWLLDLLDLPRDATVGFVTGATMAAFVGLAAARTAVLARAGHDYEANGLQGAPMIRVFMSDDAHVTNFVALRHIGLGDANIVRIRSDDQGRMEIQALATALARHAGPKIILAQAGHINSGAFDDFAAISALAKQHNAWMHVDGAFGLWARVHPDKRALAYAVDLADSWSVDGHKWLQVPYDSGFAIVRDQHAHRRAMDITASYLTGAEEDGRNPTHYVPELSRRARGFAAWAVLQTLGREGIRTLVERHCACAKRVSDRLRKIEGLKILNEVELNQVAIGASPGFPNDGMEKLAERLNASGQHFFRTAIWKGTPILRLSVIGQATFIDDAEQVADQIARAWLGLVEGRSLHGRESVPLEQG